MNANKIRPSGLHWQVMRLYNFKMKILSQAESERNLQGF